MIVINSNMLTGDSTRLNLVTSSRDYLANVDYPLRPTVHRMWGKPMKPRSKWHFCYFPQSFPVYRMQKMISVILCLLVMVLLSVVAFVLVQVVPPQQFVKSKSVSPEDVIENGIASEEDYRKQESGLDLIRTARKLEDHAEYKRSVDYEYTEEEDENYADDDEDDLVLNNYGDSDYDRDYNPVFDMKYFDFSRKEREIENPHGVASSLDKQPLLNQFKTPNIRKKWTHLPKVTLESEFNMDIIEDGVVFSKSVEALLPEPELTDGKISEAQSRLRSAEVSVLQEPTWEKCGRPKNQWLEMSTGEAACARYRYPDDYLLVGEVLSFYLSRLLGVGHVPPVVLSQPEGSAWRSVQKEMQLAGWGDAPVLVLTPWIQGLVRDHMPSILLNAVVKNETLISTQEKRDDAGRRRVKKVIERDLKGHDERRESPSADHAEGGSTSLRELSERDLTKLLQWSDLVVFDYLTGNYDRVAYMQDAVEKEGQMRALGGTVHNLVRNKKTDSLWLLDNESGLMDAYSLLYGTADPVQANRFKLFHRQMLYRLCVFRRSTMEAVLGLHEHPEPHAFLVDFAKQYEPLFHLLPDPLQNPLFVEYFPIRVKEVYEWMSTCIDRVEQESSFR